MIVIVIVILASVSINAFLLGGFLGCILAGVNEKEVSLNNYIQGGKRYFTRFLAMVFLIITVLFLSFFILIAFLPLAPILIIAMLIFGVLLIFWDYILVAKDANLIEAAVSSINFVKKELGKIVLFIIPIIILTAIFSIFANFLISISPIGAILAILLYSYYGTAIVFAMMSFYMDTSGQEEEEDPNGE